MKRLEEARAKPSDAPHAKPCRRDATRVRSGVEHGASYALVSWATCGV